MTNTRVILGIICLGIGLNVGLAFSLVVSLSEFDKREERRAKELLDALEKRAQLIEEWKASEEALRRDQKALFETSD